MDLWIYGFICIYVYVLYLCSYAEAGPLLRTRLLKVSGRVQERRASRYQRHVLPRHHDVFDSDGDVLGEAWADGPVLVFSHALRK